MLNLNLRIEFENKFLHPVGFLPWLSPHTSTCLFEKASSLHVRSHSSEYDAKIVLVVIQYGLPRQLDKRALPTDLLRGYS